MAYDFSGYATRNDLECGDGRIIRRDAFKDNDQTRVPLVWQHLHDDPGNVLGHADLENREDGVYAYCEFNDTPGGQNAKQLVQHGDVTSMSIYANRLKQQGPNVIHGIIREVSLVLAGANPGALIDPLSIAHGDGTYTDIDDEAIITTGDDFLIHADSKSGEDTVAKEDTSKTDNITDDKTIQDIIDTMNEEQKNVLYYLVGAALDKANGKEPKPVKHSDDFDDTDDDEMDDSNDSDETIQDVINTMNEKQKKAMYFMVGLALNDGKANNANTAQHDDFDNDGTYFMEDDTMKFNAFDNPEDVAELSHSDIEGIMNEARNGSNGSLKQSFLAHGIENLEVLYPEAKLVGQNPELISRDMTWVDKVWGELNKRPFARIRSVAANVTAYEARARGYIKGNQKEEEVLSLLARTTTPQTVYKLQKIDRDDVVDITDLDVVAWMKQEMRVMLNEEIVRAIMVGDDRPSSDPSYINPEHIRPIYQDNDVYTIHDTVTISASATFNDIAEAIITHAVLARKNYMGSGTPTMYASTDVITRMLLATDTLGHRMYRNESELASALRVKEIVEVPVFDGIKRTAQVSTTNGGTTTTTSEERKLLAIIVNLADYAVGADKGGEVNLFDNFDLNFNKYEYLIETRCSGALTKPYSAIAIETTSELPFTFGTVSGMYEGSATQKKASGTTGTTGD